MTTLYLSKLVEDVGNNFVDGTNELEEIVVGEVLEGKLTLARVARICLAQDSMTYNQKEAISLVCVWVSLSLSLCFSLSLSL